MTLCSRSAPTGLIVLEIGLKLSSKKIVGKVYLVNIGIPNKVYSDLGIKVKNYFSKEEILTLR